MLEGNQAHTRGGDHGLGPAASVQLGHDGRYVKLDGVFADVQFVGYGLVGGPLCKLLQDLQFPGRDAFRLIKREGAAINELSITTKPDVAPIKAFTMLVGKASLSKTPLMPLLSSSFATASSETRATVGTPSV